MVACKIFQLTRIPGPADVCDPVENSWKTEFPSRRASRDSRPSCTILIICMAGKREREKGRQITKGLPCSDKENELGNRDFYAKTKTLIFRQYAKKKLSRIYKNVVQSSDLQFWVKIFMTLPFLRSFQKVSQYGGVRKRKNGGKGISLNLRKNFDSQCPTNGWRSHRKSASCIKKWARESGPASENLRKKLVAEVSGALGGVHQFRKYPKKKQFFSPDCFLKVFFLFVYT